DAALAVGRGADLQRVGPPRRLVRLNRRIAVLAPAARDRADRRRLEALADQELAGRAQRRAAEARGAARSPRAGHGARATWRTGSAGPSCAPRAGAATGRASSPS